mgnify:CR=1 FL=1
MKLMYRLESIEMRVDDHKMCRDANVVDLSQDAVLYLLLTAKSY